MQALLMGGQACVFYGAAEFSRDLDLLILVDGDNLKRLQKALDELEAHVIAAPPFQEKFLLAGHAVPFRCRAADVSGLRIDVMARLRGVAAFADLWKRRTTIQVAEDVVDLLSVDDLVTAKKTQRDKDWPMIGRLVEQNYFENRAQAGSEQVRFWLRELRTPELLIAASAAWPQQAGELSAERPAVAAAVAGDEQRVRELLRAEEEKERRRDRDYWLPLRQELSELRRAAQPADAGQA